MSPPPEKHTPSMSLGTGMPGSTTATSAPAFSRARTYRARAAAAAALVRTGDVRAMRGRGVTTQCYESRAERRSIDELHQHAVRGARMKERHHSLDTLSRHAVDELDAGARQAIERALQVVDDEADVVQRGSAPLRDEPTHAGGRIG